jgi:hypothetical protein
MLLACFFECHTSLVRRLLRDTEDSNAALDRVQHEIGQRCAAPYLEKMSYTIGTCNLTLVTLVAKL